ncbi:hypothetical protein Tco_0489120 [Tanacetum coccineum]
MNELMSTPIDFTAFAMITAYRFSDLTKLTLVGSGLHSSQTALARGGSSDRSYMTSLTKTKAAKYDLQGIEDMVPTLWSPIKVAYDRHAALGTSHWGPKRQRFYGYATNKVSKHDVYSNKRIMAVTNVKVNKWYGYGHLEEIKVRRSDQKLYKFMEDDFPRLYLNDIEDMLLLVVQNKLFNLDGEVIVHLAAALLIFTRQPYTAYSNPQGVIYLDKLERNRLMCTHELYKFSDGTLISVWDKLKDMANNLKMGYNSVMPRRRWSNLDNKRSRIMVKNIDCQLLERRLLRSLEKFVGGREYGEDLRLL